MGTEEENLLILTGPKKVKKAIAETSYGLWKSWTARFNAFLAAVSVAVMNVPLIGELAQLGYVGLVHAAHDNVGLLLPALDIRVAAWVAFVLAVLNIALRARTAGARPK
jgi:hypothetical protein